MNKLDFIINHWPSAESERTKRHRAVRVARGLFPSSDISSSSLLSDARLREVIGSLPKDTPGLDAAGLFIQMYHDFPADEWEEMCERGVAKDREREIEYLRQEEAALSAELDVVDDAFEEAKREIRGLKEILTQMTEQTSASAHKA